MVMPCQVSGQLVVANSWKLPQPSVGGAAVAAPEEAGGVCASAEPEASNTTIEPIVADLDESMPKAPWTVIYGHI
jgi:hypothetical protein